MFCKSIMVMEIEIQNLKAILILIIWHCTGKHLEKESLTYFMFKMELLQPICSYNKLLELAS
jgi:hypothetical protein